MSHKENVSKCSLNHLDQLQEPITDGDRDGNQLALGVFCEYAMKINVGQ